MDPEQLEKAAGHEFDTATTTQEPVCVWCGAKEEFYRGTICPDKLPNIEALSQLIEREKRSAYAEGMNRFNAVEINGVTYPKGAIRKLNEPAKRRRKQ